MGKGQKGISPYMVNERSVDKPDKCLTLNGYNFSLPISKSTNEPILEIGRALVSDYFVKKRNEQTYGLPGAWN